ncbi:MULTISPECIES: sugar-binding protein [Bacteria]|uniref:sugar-binding protein n=1 Tax=Bacteria TaxID=2 RepID=UPI0012B16D0E|nr:MULTISPECIES: sugar-binding protein [Bacteria]MRY42787.1 family 16 glycosylhydrolase [Parabacteroides distasonis]MZK52081.1 family 16 glycosylhydrolase [Clostridium beijerinckii]MZK60222.1 family 16 glycosylhydrolase [Clostridium beijerinckii]MZK70507.1 family 16 glycosylhydrolase [Clostridium beijerinckii]MZK75809.1 family 16 glycosylhydrolase [Clostridium beijerinckii]
MRLIKKSSLKNLTIALSAILLGSSLFQTGVSAQAAEGDVIIPVEKKVSTNPVNEVLDENSTILPASDPENTRKWKLSETMSDEFESSKLDSTKWHDNHIFWSGRQPSCFDSSNVRIENGKLILRTNYVDEETEAMKKANEKLPEGAPKYKNYSASCVMSTQKTGYGYYEIKAKTAPVSISSAFWFRDPKVAKKEIDVFEQVGRAKNNLLSDGSNYPINTHDFEKGEANQISTPCKLYTGIDLTADHHIYGLEWDENFLRFYIDGKIVHEIKNVSMKQALYTIFDMESFVYDVIPADKEDFKYVNGRFTGDYEIEYFRVWRSDVPQSTELSDVETNRTPQAKLAVALYGSPNITTNSTKIDPIWEKAAYVGKMHAKGGDPQINAKVKTMWDEDYLYVLVDVDDKDIYAKADCTELYIDGGNEKVNGPYDANDYFIKIFPDGNVEKHKNTPEGCIFNSILKSDKSGYYTQYKIPIKDVQNKDNKVIGFDIQINDGDSKREFRRGYIGWNDTRDNAWYSLYTTGNLYLMKLEK